MTYCAFVMTSVAVAWVSQTLFEHRELPLAAPTTPTSWPAPTMQPASFGFVKSSDELRMGWMALHNTTMLTLTSVTPSPFTSTHAVFGPLQGTGIPFAGSGMAFVGVAVNWVVLMTCSMTCCAAESACLRCCMFPTICRSLLPSLKEATARSEISINMIRLTINAAPCCREDGEFMACSFRPDYSTLRPTHRHGVYKRR